MKNLISMIFVIFLVGCNWPTPQEVPYDATLVASNKTKLASCMDLSNCVGGFVHVRNDSTVLRLMSCYHECKNGEVGIQSLQLQDPNKFIIILPNEKEKWEQEAINYSKQFLMIKSPLTSSSLAPESAQVRVADCAHDGCGQTVFV